MYVCLLFIVTIDVIRPSFVVGFIIARPRVALVFILEDVVRHCKLLSLTPLAILILFAPIFSLMVKLRTWYELLSIRSNFSEAFMLGFVNRVGFRCDQ